MKGIILAGGLGKRLFPLTKVTNKHLLPIYSRPMVYYPIQTLVDAGIKDIMIVTGGNHAGEFLRLLGNGYAIMRFWILAIGKACRPKRLMFCVSTIGKNSVLDWKCE